MLSRRNFLSILLASCLAWFIWLNFSPTALALGGKQLPLNQPAPEFTLPTNTGLFHSRLRNLGAGGRGEGEEEDF